MNEKEIGELRRRVRRERSNMTTIYGCYVNTQKEIIATIKESVGLMSENEAEKYFGVLRRTLSGTLGKNLIDINFQTAQVAGSPEHKLLMGLRNTALKDEESRMALYRKIIENLSADENYLILLSCETYDVPFKSKDDTQQEDASTEAFTYLLCAVCPVKERKPSLRYISQSREFHDEGLVQEVSAPALGFLFPAFDNRSANIYNALFYARDTKVSYQNVIDALFNTTVPKPAGEQKKSFEALLASSLKEECNLEVVQTVHDEIRMAIDMHKESKIPEPLQISKEQVKGVLAGCGVSAKNISKFSVEYDEVFGYEAELYPKNIINNNRFEIKTPSVSIKVDPQRSDLIETRVIGGVKYILINADEDVEVNGVSIHIKDTQAVEV